MRKAWMILLLSALATAGWSAVSQDAAWTQRPKRADAIRVRVVTGGHDHDPEFYSVFDDEAIKAIVEPHPQAFSSDLRKLADVLVLYDYVQELEPKKQANLRDFVESGKGVVVLHHAICNNVNWPWWYEEVVGGRYLFETFNGKKSSYKHDEELTIKPAMQHPILKGLGTFRIHDETYKDMWIAPKVKVLLTTDNPTSYGPVAWISPYEKSCVVYIQLGHDRNTNLNPNWQKLVRNAIQWAAGKDVSSSPLAKELKSDNLYYKALQAYIESADDKYGPNKSGRKGERDYKDLLVAEETWLKEPRPSQFGSRKVTFVTAQDLSGKYLKEKTKIPVTVIRPMQNEGSAIIISFTEYWFSYSKNSRRENLTYAMEGGCMVRMEYDSSRNEFVIAKVELWGV